MTNIDWTKKHWNEAQRIVWRPEPPLVVQLVLRVGVAQPMTLSLENVPRSDMRLDAELPLPKDLCDLSGVGLADAAPGALAKAYPTVGSLLSAAAGNGTPENRRLWSKVAELKRRGGLSRLASQEWGEGEVSIEVVEGTLATYL